MEEFRAFAKPISMDIRVAEAVKRSMKRATTGQISRDSQGRKLLHPLPYVLVGKKDAGRDITTSVTMSGRVRMLVSVLWCGGLRKVLCGWGR